MNTLLGLLESPLGWLAVGLAAASLAFLLLGASALRRRRAFRASSSALLGLLLLTAGALCAALSVGTQGYRAFTREEIAAVVSARPTGAQRFLATFHFPGGRTERYQLAGDELYVDARILKWKPIVNWLGLHTAYELDRVAGRYRELEHERTGPRTVFALGADRPLDLFALRRRTSLLAPLVDVEYGSATFAPAGAPAEYEVRVSTTGLLIRRVSPADR
ncbi:MAG: hypothetical protein V3U03_17730 [Myxococcota bacterium]